MVHGFKRLTLPNVDVTSELTSSFCMRYFFLLPSDRFHQLIIPALAACWRHGSFTPARNLCPKSGFLAASNLSTARSDCLDLNHGSRNVPFRRDLWKLLVTEALIANAVELPQIETPLDSYADILGQEPAEERLQFSPIQRAILGSRDLVFGGGYYRPDAVGWNNVDDVDWLADWLAQINTSAWDASLLKRPGTSNEGRMDEFQFALEWFPELCGIYRRAHEISAIVICEEI
jgi:hypothetical protein